MVTGVMEDINRSVIPNADLLVRIERVTEFNQSLSKTNPGNAGSCVSFLLLKPGMDLKGRTDEIQSFFKERYWIYRYDFVKEARVVPLSDIYFGNTASHSLNQGDKRFSLVLMSVGILILIFAIINYINLTVAQAGQRAKEMATRRLLGSSRVELFLRLMLEATFLTVVSFAIGLMFAKAALPYANDLLQVRLTFDVLATPLWIGAILLFIVLTGALSGVLPALMISSAKPIDVVRGTFRSLLPHEAGDPRKAELIRSTGPAMGRKSAPWPKTTPPQGGFSWPEMPGGYRHRAAAHGRKEPALISLLARLVYQTGPGPGRAGDPQGLWRPLRDCGHLPERAAVRRKFLAGTLSGPSPSRRTLQQPVGRRVLLRDTGGVSAGGAEAGLRTPLRPRRMEYVSGLAVSVLILLMGLELGKTSIEKILHPEPVDSSPLIFAILCASILVKLYMFLYNRRLGKKLASPAMEATAMDSLSDSVATAAVLIATLVGRFTGLEIDAGAACWWRPLFSGPASMRCGTRWTPCWARRPPMSSSSASGIW